MLAASPVFGFLNYFLRMSNVGMVMHAVTLTREEEPRVRSKLRKLSRAGNSTFARAEWLVVIVSRQFPQRSTAYPTVPQSRDRLPQSLHSLSVTWKPERHQIRLRVEAK